MFTALSCITLHHIDRRAGCHMPQHQTSCEMLRALLEAATPECAILCTRPEPSHQTSLLALAKQASSLVLRSDVTWYWLRRVSLSPYLTASNSELFSRQILETAGNGLRCWKWVPAELCPCCQASRRNCCVRLRKTARSRSTNCSNAATAWPELGKTSFNRQGFSATFTDAG